MILWAYYLFINWKRTYCISENIVFLSRIKLYFLILTLFNLRFLKILSVGQLHSINILTFIFNSIIHPIISIIIIINQTLACPTALI